MKEGHGLFFWVFGEDPTEGKTWAISLFWCWMYNR